MFSETLSADGFSDRLVQGWNGQRPFGREPDALLLAAQEGEHLTHKDLTASIGIVTSDATTRDAEELLHASDAAMYSAKAQGKARWVTGDPPSFRE